MMVFTASHLDFHSGPICVGEGIIVGLWWVVFSPFFFLSPLLKNYIGFPKYWCLSFFFVLDLIFILFIVIYFVLNILFIYFIF